MQCGNLTGITEKKPFDASWDMDTGHRNKAKSVIT